MRLTSYTRRKPRKGGSIHNESISDFEKEEYRQTGTIRIKEPSVFSEDRVNWPFGCYRKIDIRDILGGEELLSWDPDVELTVISRVYITEFGIIGVEDRGSHYLLEVADRYRRKEVLHHLELFGCRARLAPAGCIAVYREKLIYD